MKHITMTPAQHDEYRQAVNDENYLRAHWEIIRDVMKLETDNFVFVSSNSPSEPDNATLIITILD